MTKPRVIGYRAALEWLARNDDTEWLSDDCGAPSVTLCLVADIYGRDVDKATADLRTTIERIQHG